MRNHQFYILFCLILFTRTAFSESEISKENYLIWAKKISKGIRTICEPIHLSEIPIHLLSAKKFARDWQAKEGMVTFGKVIVPISFAIPPYKIRKHFDTKKIPSQLISSILNYRKSIRNNISAIFDEEGKEFLGDGYNFVYFSPNVILGYLEYFQILTLNLLLVNNDFRFANEAESLLSYIKETREKVDLEEAIWHYESQLNGRCFERLIKFYLKKCKIGLD